VTDYKEAWDITTQEGSLCFAGAIYSRLVGGRQDESELLWLAEYLRVNSTTLAQPEPEGVTLDHVNLIGFALGREPWATWLKPGGCLESAHCEMSELLLAAITRYARTTTEPVPVTERPWEREGWCDAEGRCWWERPSEELCNSDWFLATRSEVEEFCDYCPPIVSLPHHALLIPIP